MAQSLRYPALRFLTNEKCHRALPAEIINTFTPLGLAQTSVL
jgi:hypothetical protein